jgi:hypothetical protein
LPALSSSRKNTSLGRGRAPLYSILQVMPETYSQPHSVKISLSSPCRISSGWRESVSAVALDPVHGGTREGRARSWPDPCPARTRANQRRLVLAAPALSTVHLRVCRTPCRLRISLAILSCELKHRGPVLAPPPLGPRCYAKASTRDTGQGPQSREQCGARRGRADHGGGRTARGKRTTAPPRPVVQVLLIARAGSPLAIPQGMNHVRHRERGESPSKRSRRRPEEMASAAWARGAAARNDGS